MIDIVHPILANPVDSLAGAATAVLVLPPQRPFSQRLGPTGTDGGIKVGTNNNNKRRV